MVSPNTDEFLDLLASSQSRRLDDQRASFSNLPGLRLTQNNNQSLLGHLMTKDSKEPDEDFFDILVKCQVCLPIFVIPYVARMLRALAVSCICVIQYSVFWQDSNLGKVHLLLGKQSVDYSGIWGTL